LNTVTKISIAVLVLAGAAAGGWWYWGAPKAASVPTTVAVTRGDIEQTVLASGVLQANSLVSVGAEVSGRIESVKVKLGQDVKKGDLLAEIDSLNQANAIKAAQAALSAIQAQKRAQEATLVQARSTLVRNTQLSGNSLVSKTDLESAQMAVDSSLAQIDQLDAQIAQAELTIESAQLNLSRTKILAPNDGTIVAVMVEEGQTVNANQATPTIVKIADLDTMVINADISEADVVRVTAGQRVYFSILGEPDKKIDATLREIEPAPSSITSDSASTDTAVYYNGLFSVPNPDHKLRISMTAQVTIVQDEAKDALLLPSGLVTHKDREGKTIVAVYDPATEQTSPRRIEVGLNNNVMAEVKSGLQEGDQVVSTGASGVRVPTGTQGQRPPGGALGFGGAGAGPRR